MSVSFVYVTMIKNMREFLQATGNFVLPTNPTRNITNAKVCEDAWIIVTFSCKIC